MADEQEPRSERTTLGFTKTDEVPEGDHLGFVILKHGAVELMYQTRESVRADVPALDAWTECARLWAKGAVPADLALADPKAKPKAAPRDVFIYFIHEGKVRAPAAAMALIERLRA